MAIFTAITAWASSSLAFMGAGGLSFLGMSPALTSSVFAVGRAVSWSLASAALSRPKVPYQQMLANITQTDGPRIKAYGRVLLGGQRAFWETDDGYLNQIILLHHGRVDGLINYWVDGEVAPVDEDGFVTREPIHPDMILGFRDGSGDGGDYPLIRDRYPTIWTTAHRIAGQATMMANMFHPGNEQFSKVWPKAHNTLLQAEIRSSLVRIGDGSLAYSENPSWCIRDYLNHQDGWRIAAQFIENASFASFAALCNEPVALRGGGTEPRYRLCGYFTLDDAPKEVTGRQQAACDGQVYQTADGTVGILGGRWSEPDVTITDFDIMSFHSPGSRDAFTDFNVLKTSFISPAHGYQPTEVADLRDLVALAEQPERIEQIDFDMSPSGGQTQRLQKILFAKKRPKLVGTLTTNLVGLKARWPKGDGIHTIRLNAPLVGLVGVFLVTSHSIDLATNTCTIGIASIDNPYPWDAATEERPLPATSAEIAKPNTPLGPPAGVTLTQIPVRVSGDTYGGKLRIVVNAVTRRDLTLQAQVAFGNVVASDESVRWTEMGGDRFSAETGILENEQVYTVRYRWRGQADWIKAGSVTIVANPNVPAAPTGFARVGTSGVSLTWTNPATNFWKTRLFRGTTTNFADASFVKDVAGLAGQVSTATDAPGTGTWRYWVVALNGSTVASPAAGPVTITI